jgi:hypothetical protein
MPDQIGDLAVQDDYQGMSPVDWMMSTGQAPPTSYPQPQSWLQKAQDLGAKDIATYQSGGVPAVIGSLADTSDAQDLAGGFGGNIKGVGGKVAPGALAALGEYHPPFYSAVERAVQDARQNTAPGQQWAGYLRNQPGVKPEEVETLGLGKLFEQPTVSKDAVLGEIAANKVNVGEVVKGLPYDASQITMKRVGDGPNAYWESFDNSGNMITRHPGSMSEAQALNDAQTFANIGPQSPTKFSQYTLPGGENYREMLLTLPTQDAAKSTRMTELEQKLRNPADYDTAELFDMRNEYRRLANETRDSGTFKSTHYDEPNILAHVRYNDRVIDGKKTLFVEEVQSDWHQKGKREGYKSEPSTDERELLGLRQKYDPTNQAALSAAEHARMAELENRVGYGLANKVRESAVPDAPFKTTWPELAMKRIIREAAEKGYDKVAWTPGSVQADRYDLSKHVDTLHYYPEDHYLVYKRKGDAGWDDVKNIPPAKLADHIGKDAAEKLLATPLEEHSGDKLGLRHVMSGVDLKVGGEGMKGFYDEILPATVNRLVKKHGGRVMQSDMTAATAASPERVHTLDITPSLRAAAMKGFPLFTAGGVAATGMMGDLAKQDDYQ